MKEKIKNSNLYKKITTLAIGLMTGTLFMPSIAYADSGQASSMIAQIATLLSQGIILAGSVFIVWGGVQVGMAIKDSSNGSQLQHGIMWIVGGVIIAAAGGYFMSISWNL